MTKTTAVLWLTLLATLAASWTHLTTLFARHEWPGWWPVAALAATAVDLGILASMMAIADLARDGRDTSDPRWTVAGLVLLSCLANAAHVLAVGQVGGRLELALAILVAASLPLIVWRLSRLLDAVTRPLASEVTESGQQTYTTLVDAPVVLAKVPASAAGRVAPPRLVKSNGQVSPDRLAAYRAAVASLPSADDRIVAEVLGVSERTARRYRAMASNGHAAGGA